MKKIISAILLVLLCCLAVLPAAACNTNSEVAGKYELATIDGTVNGYRLDKSMYEYFTLDFSPNGKFVMKSKAAGNSTTAEVSGLYSYKEGVITVTTKNGSVVVKEEYAYSDGVISMEYNGDGQNFLATFVRVGDSENNGGIITL